jgi:hypothetical protein
MVKGLRWGGAFYQTGSRKATDMRDLWVFAVALVVMTMIGVVFATCSETRPRGGVRVSDPAPACETTDEVARLRI